MEYLTSKHFPDSMQGNLLVADVIQFRGILNYKIEDKGSSFAGIEQTPILQSTDINFRPSDLKIGPDGAIWFLDWCNPIVGHLQHAIRDPARDRTHGRIYRITYEGRELDKPTAIAGEPIPKLLALLSNPEERVSYRARAELGSRKVEDVIPAVKTWIAGLDKTSKDYEHNMLEALWVHQNFNVVDKDLLIKVLTSPDFRARAAATRVLTYWRDSVPEAMNLFKQQAADSHPRVRLEAVRAASFFNTSEAVEIPVIAADLGTDIYLDFTRAETMKVIEPILKAALAKGEKINFTTDSGARYLLRNVNLEQLLKMERSKAVCLELLYRPGVSDEQRRAGLRDMAKLDMKPELKVLLDAIAHIDAVASGSGDLAGRDESIVFDLIRLLTGRNKTDLTEVRPELEKLATTAKKALIRQVGYVAIVNVDGATDKAWELATKSVGGLRDLLSAMPLMWRWRTMEIRSETTATAVAFPPAPCPARIVSPPNFPVDKTRFCGPSTLASGEE